MMLSIQLIWKIKKFSIKKTTEKIYSITKPNTFYEYINYYLKVITDNSDVLVMRYPTEISFDESNEATIGVSFKGVINATSQWAPRIHNGYYYLPTVNRASKAGATIRRTKAVRWPNSTPQTLQVQSLADSPSHSTSGRNADHSLYCQ